MGYTLPYIAYYSILRISIIGIVLGLVSFLAFLRRKSKFWLILCKTSFFAFTVYTVKVDSGYISSSASSNIIIVQLRVFPKTIRPFYEKVSFFELQEESREFNRFVFYEKEFEIESKDPMRLPPSGPLF